MSFEVKHIQACFEILKKKHSSQWAAFVLFLLEEVNVKEFPECFVIQCFRGSRIRFQEYN